MLFVKMIRKLVIGSLLLGSSVYLARRYVIWRRCACTTDIRTKRIIVTGATSGIGLAVAQQLALRGASIILACRDLCKAADIQRYLTRTTNNPNIHVEHLDLQSLSSVAAFAGRINSTHTPIYALVNNAAVFYAPPQSTEDQLEVTFQTNYVAPFLLTLLLLPSLRSNPGGARIVNLSSQAHTQADNLLDPVFFQPYDDTLTNRFAAYQHSKFYLVQFSKRLQDILNRSAVSVHCVDPGNVETDIFRTFPPLAHPFWFAIQKPIRLFCVKTPNEGAQGVLHALLAPTAPAFYLEHLTESTRIHHRISDPRLSESIWRTTRQMCQPHLTSTA